MKILAIGDFHGKFPEKLKSRLKKEIELENVDLILGLGDYTGLEEWRPLIFKQMRAHQKGSKVSSIEEILGKKRYKDLLRRDYNAGLNVLKALNKLGKPCLVIFGNGDWYYYPFDKKTKLDEAGRYDYSIKRMRNMRLINYDKTKFKEINFIGFGGYMDIDAFFKKKDEIKKRLARRNASRKMFFNIIKKTKEPRIFVLHYTPKATFDIIHGGKKNPMTGKSAGIGFFNEAIKKYKPKLVFCGHMHEYQGKKWLGKSLVVNPGDAERGRFAIVDTDSSNVKFFR